MRLAQRPDLVVFVGVPVDAPVRWERASSYTDVDLQTPSRRILLSDVKAFVVAYPNHQVLDANLRQLPIPDGLSYLAPDPAASNLLASDIDLEEVLDGAQLVAVGLGPSASKPRAKDHYRTSLENRAGEPVRIVQFGAYVENRGRYELNTVTGKMFSADEFIAWYAAPADGWIQPGATVSDPDNYGGGPCLWVYRCETKSGRSFVTGVAIAAS